MPKKIKINKQSFHGTSPHDATSIINNGVDINSGGGELGKGFYTTNRLFVAKAWAWNAKNKSRHVISFEVPRNEIGKLNKRFISDLSNLKIEIERIKGVNLTRSFQYQCDVVVAPLRPELISKPDFIKHVKAGDFYWAMFRYRYIWDTDGFCPIQIKWESERAEAILNKTTTKKRLA